jgi:membrane-associated phospholipid phosphatase
VRCEFPFAARRVRVRFETLGGGVRPEPPARIREGTAPTDDSCQALTGPTGVFLCPEQPMSRSRTPVILAATLQALCGAPTLAAQQPDTSTLKRIPLFTRNDAYLAVFFLGGTAALAPLDRSIAGRLQNPNTQANRLFQNLSTDVRLIAVPGSVIIGTSMYVVGRLAHKPRIADLGLHGEEAILVGNIVNTAIKWTAGRARPYVVADTNPRDYQLFRGLREGRDYSSFPSGHVLAAFAVAAAVSNEASRWWPTSRWYVGTVMYGGATAVALSRLYNNQHWASDVIMAAGIGTFAGNKVVRYHHRTNPGNRIDRWLLAATIAPGSDGSMSVIWSVHPESLH